MAKSFPQNFDLRRFSGPRAKQFTKPEDAFQQLVGDALKEMAGPGAHISPTRGRDGSIDAFLLEGAPLHGPFEKLPLPLIVECKTHDHETQNVDRNILGQWRLMEQKLEANARAGWKDLFEPWLKTRGYAYCISAQMPNEQLRNKLTGLIQEFFSTLPSDQRPPIELIRVVDWNDLRQWLETLPHVSDAWLGVGLDLILDHASFLSRLSGFREYLLSSKLKFVPPAPDSPSHPERILEGVEKECDKKGILLVGAGGVGKTRTAIEVGTLAEDAGWRVLHVLPDEPGVETEDIARIVLPYRDSRTLLVFDYIDQMQRLDLASIDRSLIPEAIERGIHLRLLANSRPGWPGLVKPECVAMFSTTELKPTDSHKAELVQVMTTQVAPKASEAIGQSEVIRLCGTRAIIALLIARELESRATDDLLKDLHTADLRSGDLVQWLQRRLQENALLVRHDEVSLTPARPPASMVAAAAALACAPETRESLIIAAESGFRHLGWPTASEDAQYLVDFLIKLGWLEAHRMFVSTAHDVVADEVLDQSIHTEATVFESEFDGVLSFAFALQNGIGRLATALRRVIVSEKNESSVLALTDFLRRWLETYATPLGKVVETGDPDLTGYALGAVLSGPPWEETAIEQWNQLILPWLKAHSAKEEARHLLYQGLRNISADQAALVALALVWLTVHGSALFATFVIRPLLERIDPWAPDAEQASRFALRWLEQHRDTLEARFVLHSLLDRSDLSIEDAEQARRFALRWLEQHHATLEARFVLSSLLERSDPASPDAEQVRRFALSWLEQHHNTLQAGFVFRPLLERSDPASPDAEQVRRFALSWLEQHHNTLQAGFVFHSLLERSDPASAEAAEARRYAVMWLEQHHMTMDAGFVFRPLLERSDPASAEAAEARRYAVMWLEQHHMTMDAGFVFPPLLERSDPASAEAAEARRYAVMWLQQHHMTTDAGFVISRLLDEREVDGKGGAFVVESAIKWLTTFYDTIEATFVLNKLFRREDVSVATRSRLLSFAIQRLRQRLDEDEASYLLRSCLQFRIEDDKLQRELVSLAIKWLELHPDNPDGEYVWNRVLRFRPNLVADTDWLKVARAALLWLRPKRVGELGVDQTANSLLMRPHLLVPSDREYTVKLGIELLGTNLNEQGRRRLVGSLKWLLPSLSEDDPLRIQIEAALRKS